MAFTWNFPQKTNSFAQSLSSAPAGQAFSVCRLVLADCYFKHLPCLLYRLLFTEYLCLHHILHFIGDFWLMAIELSRRTDFFHEMQIRAVPDDTARRLIECS